MGDEIDVAAGLVFRNGRLLITRRRANDHLGGLWEFPGGKQEPNETLEECLKRELREELGIEVQVGERLAAITHCYAERTVRLSFFRCASPDGEPQAIGCDALAWISADELGAYAFPPADQQLLKKLRESPQLWREKS